MHICPFVRYHSIHVLAAPKVGRNHKTYFLEKARYARVYLRTILANVNYILTPKYRIAPGSYDMINQLIVSCPSLLSVWMVNNNHDNCQ